MALFGNSDPLHARVCSSCRLPCCQCCSEKRGKGSVWGCAQSRRSEPLGGREPLSASGWGREADGPSDATTSWKFMVAAGSPPRCVYRDVFRISFLIYERGSLAGAPSVKVNHGKPAASVCTGPAPCACFGINLLSNVLTRVTPGTKEHEKVKCEGRRGTCPLLPLLWTRSGSRKVVGGQPGFSGLPKWTRTVNSGTQNYRDLVSRGSGG